MSGTSKYSIAALAPAIRGIPAMTCWYTAGVKRSAVQLVWSRISRHSVSISTRNDSRQASSCGESTRTPSTSKIAPRNAIIGPPSGSAGGSLLRSGLHLLEFHALGLTHPAPDEEKRQQRGRGVQPVGEAETDVGQRREAGGDYPV